MKGNFSKDYETKFRSYKIILILNKLILNCQETNLSILNCIKFCLLEIQLLEDQLDNSIVQFECTSSSYSNQILSTVNNNITKIRPQFGHYNNNNKMISTNNIIDLDNFHLLHLLITGLFNLYDKLKNLAKSIQIRQQQQQLILEQETKFNNNDNNSFISNPAPGAGDERLVDTIVQTIDLWYSMMVEIKDKVIDTSNLNELYSLLSLEITYTSSFYPFVHLRNLFHQFLNTTRNLRTMLWILSIDILKCKNLALPVVTNNSATTTTTKANLSQ